VTIKSRVLRGIARSGALVSGANEDGRYLAAVACLRLKGHQHAPDGPFRRDFATGRVIAVDQPVAKGGRTERVDFVPAPDGNAREESTVQRAKKRAIEARRKSDC
jgi:hypothetical protein